MAFLSNGTAIYVVDPAATTPTVYKLCGVSIELNEGEPSKIDVTTLCETEKTREVDGLLGSSNSSITFNFDPQAEVQKLLWRSKKEKLELAWRVAASDGTSDPTYTKGTGWDSQTDRTTFDFTGNVSTFPFSFAVNSAVQPQASVNMTSAITMAPKQ